MNNLSWMLYLAELSNNVGTFFGVVGGLGLFVLLISVLVLSVVISDSYGENETRLKELRGRLIKFVLPLLIFFIFLASIIPSKQTIYMIIASEAGEDALKSETGKKALEAVNRYLDTIGVEEKEKQD